MAKPLGATAALSGTSPNLAIGIQRATASRPRKGHPMKFDGLRRPDSIGRRQESARRPPWATARSAENPGASGERRRERASRGRPQQNNQTQARAHDAPRAAVAGCCSGRALGTRRRLPSAILETGARGHPSPAEARKRGRKGIPGSRKGLPEALAAVLEPPTAAPAAPTAAPEAPLAALGGPSKQTPTV